MTIRTRSLACALVAGLAVPATAVAQQAPRGFKQILPRGRIAAVNEPEWVAAEQAKIPDDAWMMGVLIEGQARAFSFAIMNAHEVVNDTIGGTPYAAVW